MQKVGFKKSRESFESYFLWRKERARPALQTINKLTGLKGKHVLDIGCGYGAMTSLLLEKGAKVSGTEIDGEKLDFAKKKFAKNSNVSFYKVSNEALPFKNAVFDVVMLFDVIEHVNDAEEMMKEVLRVVKKGGIIYAEFTPFYSITGHHLYDYSKLPIHLIFPKYIKQMIYQRRIDGIFSQDYYWELYLSLNKLKISRFQNMMKQTKKIEEKFIIKYPEVFSLNIPLLNFLGPFKDFFTMSFEGVYLKP